MNKNEKTIWIGIGVVIAIVMLVAVIGAIALRPEPEMIAGEVAASEYRVTNKVPGRIDKIYVSEGDQVQAGDTLAYVNSPEVDAKMDQAKAARNAASAQSTKAQNGARQQQIAGAYEMWQKAEVGVDIAKKSFDRVQALYEKKVISAQKRDEAEAQYKAALATARAAKSQYDMAMEGAQNEDKAAANALVAQANGAIREVNSYISERFIISPCNGEVTDIFPMRSDLIGTGSPVMNILDISQVWFTFSVREDLLQGLHVGSLVKVRIPALGSQTYPARITYMKAMASYATWRTTKSNGQYDVKSFDLKAVPEGSIEGLRPGMTAIIVNEK